MPLDLPAIAVAGQTIKYARAVYDVTRDGGSLGLHSIPSQQLPGGSIVLGLLYRFIDPFTDLGTSGVVVTLGNDQPIQTVDPVAQNVGAAFIPDTALAGADTSLVITVLITGDGYSAGSMLIYLFYV